MRIRLLDPGVIGKIAAGEVIQRPVNVVKELVENSLDARSTSITIEIKNGGMDYIRVTDNGAGIEAQDALVAFERHATSKLRSEDELYALHTLGFRGEALASIAAVSHITLTTRAQETPCGYMVTIHGGELIEHSETGSPEGTTVIVRNLFYNTPVRRHIANKATLEASHIGDMIARMILSNPGVSFRYLNSDRVVYHSTGSGDMPSALFCVYGKTILPTLLSVNHEDGYIGIEGYVSNLDVNRSNRTQQNFFVNGRTVRSGQLSDAVQEAYGERLPKGKYPILVLKVTIAPGEVDVNVHPTKQTVRFFREERVKAAMTQAVRAALAESDGVPKLFPRLDPMTRTEAEPLDAKANSLRELMRPQTGAVRARMSEEYKRAPSYDAVPAQAGIDAKREERKATGEQSELQKPIHIIGNAYETYWFVQQGGEVYIVDQHAAHERLNYDALRKSIKSGGAQQLLEPEIVRLTNAQSHTLESNRATLEELGFEIDDFGPLTYRIVATPYVIRAQSAERFLLDALDALESRRASPEQRLETLMLMACKASVKAGDSLSHEELRYLFEAQDRDGPLTCPHGRPIMLKFTKPELERLFKR